MLRLASKPRTTASRDALRTAIRDRVPFTSSGALSARDGHQDRTGQLRNDAYWQYQEERPTYTVYSYDTPIAWWSKQHGWTVPNVKYSVTTTNHQSQVRAAVR